MDTNNESFPSTGPINDRISGFTIARLFQAMQSDVSSLQQYKERLQVLNGYNANIVSLFNEYHY